MPPRAKATGTFASLIGSDSEPDFDSFDELETQVSRNTTKTMGAAKRRGRPPANANRVTKPAQRGGRGTTGGASRQALLERSNKTTGNAKQGRKSDAVAEEAADRTEEETVEPTQPKRGRPKALASSRGGPAPKAGRGRPPKAKPAPVRAAEPQPSEPMEVDEADAEDEPRAQTEDEAEPATAPDAVEEETMMDVDGDDVSVRRRLGDLSKRYESLEARYKDLRDVGVKEAERNYERLKKQSEENSAGQSIPTLEAMNPTNTKKLRIS